MGIEKQNSILYQSL